MNPIIIPVILGKFKLSFKKIADKISIIIGVRVTITPLFIGVESKESIHLTYALNMDRIHSNFIFIFFKSTIQDVVLVYF